MSKAPFKIVSGGQTGADRAALDWAIKRGNPQGGWCPKGRKAEDGPIDIHYQLNETPRADYLQRTEWNVRDSDGTVIFSIAESLSGGSKKTVEFAKRHSKPVLHVSKANGIPAAAEMLRRFCEQHSIGVLNVAGPRASKEPDVAAFVNDVLERTWPSP